MNNILIFLLFILFLIIFYKIIRILKKDYYENILKKAEEDLRIELKKEIDEIKKENKKLIEENEKLYVNLGNLKSSFKVCQQRHPETCPLFNYCNRDNL